MPGLNQKGFAHILVLLILLLGLIVGLYLVTHPTIFRPKAGGGGTRIEFVNDTGELISETASRDVKLKLIYAASSPSVSPSPSEEPSPSTIPTLPKQVKMMLIQYIPPGGVTTVYPGAEIPDPTNFMKNTMVPAMNRGTQFHGYSNPSAPAAINFTLADEDIHTIESPPPMRSDNYLGFPPKADNQPGYIDMPTFFSSQNICNIAKQKDIRTVVLMAADYGPYAPKGFEDYITGNKGIPTNGPILRGSQYCDDKTIYIVSPVYTRGLPEALESYGHHLEGLFRHFKPTEYASWSDEMSNPMFVGPYFPAYRGDSCGIDHDPPNARNEYDRSNTANFQSDCRNWKADGTGTKENLNCNDWGCSGDGWLVWWMQNMPPGWWTYLADPDGSVQGISTAYAQSLSFPTNFKVANDSPDNLASAQEQDFNQNGKIINWTLSDGTGTKTVYAQFKVDGAWQQPISNSISLKSATKPATAGANLTLVSDKTSYSVKDAVKVVVSVQTDTPANLFSAKINFDKNKLRIDSVDYDNSFVTKWVEQYTDQDSGTISLVGGVPDPGFGTKGSPVQMAVLHFTALTSGTTNISFTDDSAIYRNSDNTNILAQKNNAAISIGSTVVGTPAPTPSATPTPSPVPTACPLAGIPILDNLCPPIPSATPLPSPSSGPAGSGDGNGDGKVDLVDLSILLSNYNKTSRFPIALDVYPINGGDGKINAFDFSQMLNILRANHTIY